MNNIYAGMTGVAVAVMLVVNGVLGAYAGNYFSAAIIHVMGLVVATVVMLARKKPLVRERGVSAFVWLGGLYGVVSTVASIVAVREIGPGASMAVSLFAQSACALAIDAFGLFGQRRARITKKKAVGLVLVLAGTALLCWG